MVETRRITDIQTATHDIANCLQEDTLEVETPRACAHARDFSYFSVGYEDELVVLVGEQQSSTNGSIWRAAKDLTFLDYDDTIVCWCEDRGYELSELYGESEMSGTVEGLASLSWEIKFAHVERFV